MLSGYIFELYTCVQVQKCNQNMCIHTLAPGGRPRVSFFFCRRGTAGLWCPQLYITTMGINRWKWSGKLGESDENIVEAFWETILSLRFTFPTTKRGCVHQDIILACLLSFWIFSQFKISLAELRLLVFISQGAIHLYWLLAFCIWQGTFWHSCCLL
jgi:hypothetical protein